MRNFSSFGHDDYAELNTKDLMPGDTLYRAQFTSGYDSPVLINTYVVTRVLATRLVLTAKGGGFEYAVRVNKRTGRVENTLVGASVWTYETWNFLTEDDPALTVLAERNRRTRLRQATKAAVKTIDFDSLDSINEVLEALMTYRNDLKENGEL